MKSLRLHKYAYLFQQMSYEEMLSVSEEWLETQVGVSPPGGGIAVHRENIGVIFSLCPWFVFFDSEFLNDILNDKLILHNDS